MKKLSTYQATKHILKKHDLRLRKKYGQNFLIDDGILQDIIGAADISETDTVLEIGPGIGTMTGLLAENAGSVVAVEVDEKLIPVLEETLYGYDNITVINEDVRKIDINELLSDAKGQIKVVANLPYYITTPIVMSLLESGTDFYSFTFMVQKEVAERMVEGPGSRDYGALSLAVQYYTDPEILFTVPQTSFFPPPKVESAVIRLIKHEKPPVDVKDEGMMFKLIRAAFNQRRKTLANALAHGAGLEMEKAEIISMIEGVGFNANVRGEQLSLEDFARLSNILID